MSGVSGSYSDYRKLKTNVLKLDLTGLVEL